MIPVRIVPTLIDLASPKNVRLLVATVVPPKVIVTTVVPPAACEAGSTLKTNAPSASVEDWNDVDPATPTAVPMAEP